MSKRDAPVAIISMAQQARPKVIGHMLDSRAQLMACSSDVAMTLSSRKTPSSQPMSYPPAPLGVCGFRRSQWALTGVVSAGSGAGAGAGPGGEGGGSVAD